MAITAEYYDKDGQLQWSEQYIFRNRYKDCQTFVTDYTTYRVIESLLLGNRYLIKIERLTLNKEPKGNPLSD